MQKKNTPYENETCLTFYKTTPDACALAHVVFSALQKGECFSWSDFGAEYAIARKEFRREFAQELCKCLKQWVKDDN